MKAYVISLEDGSFATVFRNWTTTDIIAECPKDLDGNYISDIEILDIDGSNITVNETKKQEKEERVEEEILDIAWSTLRSNRNSLLSSCDWTDLVHCPLDTEEKENWLTYRQALRDLPENTIDPSDVTWPEQP